MSKSSLAVIILVVLGIAMIFAIIYRGPIGALFSQNVPEPAETTPVVPQTVAYATTTFSLQYPADYTLNEKYFYEQFSGKPIGGISLTIPSSMATGTNLSADTYLSVEQLPRAKNCTADIFIPANVTAHEVFDSGTTYSVASTSGAGAGNFYEELVYALPSSSPCTAVRYLIHSTNVGNYPAGMVREYDRAALFSVLDTIRRSLVLK